MRRSSAPSYRKNPISSSLTIPNKLPLKSNNADNLSGESLEKAKIPENAENPSNENQNCYSVVWSKRTTKKHKTWEGDGTLEGHNTRYILKDTSGNILGTSNSIKPEQLFEGSILLVGSKEVEIQERMTAAPTPTPKRESAQELVENFPPKKKKFTNVFKPNLVLLKTKPQPSVSPKQNEDLNPLILPTPNYFHQQKFNESKRPLAEVKISNSLLKYLRPHQREGVIFLYECIQGFRNTDNFGAILADDMGLGKTLQCLTVCHTLLKQNPYGGDPVIRRILIVTPSSLTQHWSEEISKWLSAQRIFSYVVDAKNKPKQYPNAAHIPFVITSYEMLVKNSDEFEEIQFDLLICDEGHRLKNSQIKVAISLKQLNIKRRIILTGTPIQNDLQEFYSLVDFVNPGVLGFYQEYKFQYETPIVNSQAPDATEEAKEIGKQRAEELTRLTSQFVLRRTQELNKKYLPKKTEFIVFVRPTELQQLMLSKVLEWYEAKQELELKETNALQTITLLKKICNHPSLIKTATNQDSPLLQYLLKILPHWTEMGPFDSAKLELVQNFLKEAIIEHKEKVVLVSNHTKTLDMLMELCSHLEYKYLRLDGSTPASERNSLVEKFNRSKSEFAIFLLSSKAGGAGLNLSGASRLLLFDNDWNPATDLQAMSRIWRDGQKNDVITYRLITAGTIEEKIFQRQIAKTSLSGCVMSKQGNSLETMKLSNEELKDLFTVQENFSTCATHEILKCKCEGKGEVISKQKYNEIKPFDASYEQNSLQVSELLYWEHHISPISADVLKEACLISAAEDIIFIFCNKSEIK